MYHRKVLLVALLAVVLLGSFLNWGVGVDKRHKSKPRAALADSIALSIEMTGDTSERQASLPDLMKQPALSMEITGDTSERQASYRDLTNQVAGWAKMVDPCCRLTP